MDINYFETYTAEETANGWENENIPETPADEIIEMPEDIGTRIIELINLKIKPFELINTEER